MNGLLGRVLLRPGRPDALRLQGPSGWLSRLAEGRRAEQLPALMANVHTLCAHGHALAARLALRAARGQAALPDAAERQRLALSVARDHLLRMAHDWPRLLPEGGGHPLPLQDCPPWQPAGTDAERLAALPAWLQQNWLGQPAPALLAALVDDPVQAAQRWAGRTETPLARLFRRELPAALALATPHRPLAVAPVALENSQATACSAAPDTGPWSRAHDSAAHPAHNAGMRLIARLTDLLRLVAPQGSDWLLAEGRALGAGQGEARVEVGRGLLCYRVGIEGPADLATVQSLQVVSPTDWNLHPAGVLAEALRAVDDSASATRLAVAFDPCIPFDIETPEVACA